MIVRHCEACRRQYEAASARSKFCGNTCRSRAHRAAGGREGRATAGDNVRPLRAVPTSGESDSADVADGGGLVASIERQLREAGRLDTWQGQEALVIARRVESGRDTLSAMAAGGRELRAAMEIAMKGVGDVESAVQRRKTQLEERRAARAARSAGA